MTICQTAPYWPNAEAQFPLYLVFKVPWAGRGVAVPGVGRRVGCAENRATCRGGARAHYWLRAAAGRGPWHAGCVANLDTLASVLHGVFKLNRVAAAGRAAASGTRKAPEEQAPNTARARQSLVCQLLCRGFRRCTMNPRTCLGVLLTDVVVCPGLIRNGVRVWIVENLSAPGILRNDVLHKFGQFSVDFRGRVLQQISNTFANNDDGLGQTHLRQFRIVAGDCPPIAVAVAAPVAVAARRTPYHLREESPSRYEKWNDKASSRSRTLPAQLRCCW